MEQQVDETRFDQARLQRPRTVVLLIILTALFVSRVVGFFLLASVGELPDGAPESWFIPFLGDGLIGISAIVIAIFLWRRSTFGVWLGAVIFHSIALFDTVMAGVNNIREPWDASPLGDMIGLGFGFLILVSVVSLYLLSRADVRRYYGVQ